MPQPTIGRIVHYTLSDYDAKEISSRRNEKGTPDGNFVERGQTYPAMIVRTFGGDHVNLQVFLDGTDTYWATSRSEGAGVGHWTWPPRV
jgi:hypothetical protein